MRLSGSGCILAAALVVALLAGCGTTATMRAPIDAAVDSYVLEGRFSLREGGRSYSGRVRWEHDRAGNRVLVQDPFGGGVADLTEDTLGARMKMSSGKIVEAPSAQILMVELTGMALPVADMGRWMAGRGTGAAGASRDTAGRVVRMERDEWLVDYSYDTDDSDVLPSMVAARSRNGLELKLRVESWVFPK